MFVRVHEVGPRDGLQNEPEVVSTEDKLAFIQRLVAAGHRDVEVTSFVRPRWIPQLADASEVLARVPRVDGVRYWALVPNQRGLERALDVGLGHIATFMSVSETHNQRNVNRTVKESLAGVRQVLGSARAEGLGSRAYLSTVFGCPYEGPVSVSKTVELGLALLDAGADVLALGDTTGMGWPALVQEVVAAFGRAGVGPELLALHLHDTRGTALANAFAALECGVRHLDASSGGLGGCPYAPGASGNLATEDLLFLLHAQGYETGIDLDLAVDAAEVVERALGRELSGRYLRQARGAQARRAARTA
jgi:hydroxymethylglutaryl-CoA lyase